MNLLNVFNVLWQWCLSLYFNFGVWSYTAWQTAATPATTPENNDPSDAAYCSDQNTFSTTYACHCL
jgi:hypothetical protein